MLSFKQIAITIAVSSFALGAALQYFHLPPATYLDESIDGAVALRNKSRDVENFSRMADEARSGAEFKVLVNKPEAYQGYTLIAGGTGDPFVLVDMEGRIVHTWHIPFSQLWKKAPHIPDPIPDSLIMPQRGRISPNGDMVAVLTGLGDTPYGYAIFKMDKDSNLIWAYPGHAHHDMDMDKDGNIYVSTQKVERRDFAQGSALVLTDTITILDPEGKEKKVIDLLDALRASPYSEMIKDIYPDEKGDVIHNNTASLIPEGHYDWPEAQPGKMLISSRNSGFIGILNLKTGVVDWMSRGNWKWPHAPRMLPNGHIVLLDNHGLMPKKRSRLLEVDPHNRKLVREVVPFPKFFAPWGGDLQVLPDGHLLLTSLNDIIEFDADYNIVWRFNARTIFNRGAYRYTAEQLPFVKELPGRPAQVSLTDFVRKGMKELPKP